MTRDVPDKTADRPLRPDNRKGFRRRRARKRGGGRGARPVPTRLPAQAGVADATHVPRPSVPRVRGGNGTQTGRYL